MSVVVRIYEGWGGGEEEGGTVMDDEGCRMWKEGDGNAKFVK